MITSYGTSQHGGLNTKPVFPQNDQQPQAMAGGGKDYKAKPLLGPKKSYECNGFNLQGMRCRAPKAKGTELCIGHLKRSLKEQ